MRKFFILLLLCLLVPYLLSAQKWDEDETFEPGVDFIIGAGIYFGGKTTAAYYNGLPENENNLDYIFKNPYWLPNDILPLIANNNNFVSPNDPDIRVRYPDDYPLDMHYKPAMSVSLGASYRFNKHLRLTLYYSFARLTAKDVFRVSYTQSYSGNDQVDLFYPIIGRENRSFFDLTFSYIFHINKWVKPFLELGGQFNFVRVKSFQAIIEDREFNLLDIYGGSTFNGSYIQEFEPHYGGAGGGAMAAAGIKFAFSQSVSIDPTFYVSYGVINLTGYKQPHFNYGVYIRLVMSDSMFQK